MLQIKINIVKFSQFLKKFDTLSLDSSKRRFSVRRTSTPLFHCSKPVIQGFFISNKTRSPFFLEHTLEILRSFYNGFSRTRSGLETCPAYSKPINTIVIQDAPVRLREKNLDNESRILYRANKGYLFRLTALLSKYLIASNYSYSQEKRLSFKN